MITIYPTHKCFDDAMEIIEQLIESESDLINNLFLVHAVCLVPDNSEFINSELINNQKEYAHAWVEIDNSKYVGIKNSVLFKGILDGKTMTFSRQADKYYQQILPQYIKKYSLEQAFEENVKHGTYGPWEQKLIDLCINKT